MKTAERLALRQEKSAPIVAALRDRLDRWKLELIPKHPMADAVNYALNQWQAMTIFLADASVPLDNNLSEREMKRVVINRKNSLFVGNERGWQDHGHFIEPHQHLPQTGDRLPTLPDAVDHQPARTQAG